MALVLHSCSSGYSLPSRMAEKPSAVCVLYKRRARSMYIYNSTCVRIEFISCAEMKIMM